MSLYPTMAAAALAAALGSPGDCESGLHAETKTFVVFNSQSLNTQRGLIAAEDGSIDWGKIRRACFRKAESSADQLAFNVETGACENLEALSPRDRAWVRSQTKRQKDFPNSKLKKAVVVSGQSQRAGDCSAICGIVQNDGAATGTGITVEAGSFQTATTLQLISEIRFAADAPSAVPPAVSFSFDGSPFSAGLPDGLESSCSGDAGEFNCVVSGVAPSATGSYRIRYLSNTDQGIFFADAVLEVLVPAGSIAGTVNARVDGLGLADIAVQLFEKVGDGFVLRDSATTGPDGRYEFSFVPVGEYTLIVPGEESFDYLPQVYARKPCGDGCVPQSGTILSVAANLASNGIDFSLFPKPTGQDIQLPYLNERGLIVDGPRDGERLGIRVSGIGDINGDGLSDVVVDGQVAPRQTYVVYGQPQTTAPDLNRLDPVDSGFVIQSFNINRVTGGGDVSGDGRPDVIVSSLLAEVNSVPQAGEVVAISSIPSSGSVALQEPGSNPGFVVLGSEQQDRVRSNAGAGDLNADGISDVVVGAPLADGFNGRAYVIFGGEETTVSTGDLGTRGFSIFGGDLTDRLGFHVGGAGDVNGDGFDDVVITAFDAVYVVFGKADLGPVNAVQLGAEGYRIGLQSHSTGGIVFEAEAAGDVNGDGLADIVLSTIEGNQVGKAYIAYGRRVVTDQVIEELPDQGEGLFLGEFPVSQGFGIDVGGAGDFNSDGFADVVLGVEGAQPGGRVDVVFGPDASNGFSVFGEPGDLLGPSSSAGDFDGDGLGDLVLGAWGASGNSPGSGKMVILLSRETIPQTATWRAYLPGGSTPMVEIGRIGDGSAFGYPASRAWLQFSGGSGPEVNGASSSAVTRFQDARKRTLGLTTSETFWDFETNRGGFDSAVVKLRYTDSEVVNLEAASLKILRADSIQGPWEELETLVLPGNQLQATTRALGVFAIAGVEKTRVDTSPSETDDSGNEFGSSLALVNDSLAVGAPSSDGATLGQVTIIDLGSSTTTQNLTSPTALAAGSFGSSLSSDGDLLAVGAPSPQDTNIQTASTASGRSTEQPAEPTVFLYEKRGDSFSLARSLASPSGNLLDEFGASLAIDDGLLAVGAPGDFNGAGAVYLFDLVSSESVRIVSSFRRFGSRFGASLAIENGTLVIGEPGNDSASGAIFVVSNIREDINDFQLSGPVRADASSYGDLFGFAVSIHEGRVLVGSPGLGDSTGAAYLFDSQPELRQVVRLNPEPLTPGARYGSAVAISSGGLIIGAPGLTENGAIFQVSPDLSATNFVGGEPGQTGFGSAVVEAGGRVVGSAPGGEGSPGSVSFVAGLIDVVFQNSFGR